MCTRAEPPRWPQRWRNRGNAALAWHGSTNCAAPPIVLFGMTGFALFLGGLAAGTLSATDLVRATSGIRARSAALGSIIKPLPPDLRCWRPTP